MNTHFLNIIMLFIGFLSGFSSANTMPSDTISNPDNTFTERSFNERLFAEYCELIETIQSDLDETHLDFLTKLGMITKTVKDETWETLEAKIKIDYLGGYLHRFDENNEPRFKVRIVEDEISERPCPGVYYG